MCLVQDCKNRHDDDDADVVPDNDCDDREIEDSAR